MSRIDPELIHGFVAEARSYVPRFYRGIEALTSEALGEARRLIHSVKGAASMLGLSALSDLAFQLETAFSDVVRGDEAADQASRAELAAHVSSFESALTDLLTSPPTLPAQAPAAPEVFDRPPELVPELVESFLEEAEDHLTAIVQALATLRERPTERPSLGEIRRSVHTLKGTAALVGFSAVSRLAHRMEDLLDLCHDRATPLVAEELNLLYATADALADAIGNGAEGAAGQEPAAFAALYSRYDEQLAATSAPSPPEVPPQVELGRAFGFTAGGAAAAAPPPAAPPRAGPAVRVPLDRLDELVRLTSELVVNRSTFEQHFGQLKKQVAELDLALARLRRLAGRLESDYEVAALAQGSARPRLRLAVGAEALSAATAGFDELELDRYTEFHRVSRQLAETSSDLGAVGGELGGSLGDFDAYLVRLNRLTGEVQDRLLSLRMVPVATLTSRLERAVRMTAEAKAKAAELVIEGAAVEIDKTVLEEIADPLLHLIRNAVDHGLEPPALRRVLGKRERGRIRVKATHEGTQVVLQVSDDGAGIEPELVREAAVAGGFLPAEEAAGLSNEGLFSLLFLPGFSTAGEISEISGRGVGLDIVESTVRRLKGTVTLDAVSGLGTTVTIRLPLSLAVLKVLLVSAGRETYAVPLAVVAQILRLDAADIERLGQEPVIRVAGQVMPLVHLAAALGQVDTPLSSPAPSAETRMPVLVINLPERRFALAVSGLIEAQDVVVKPLGPHLQRVHGITGATLTGDGRVVLILNPAELVESKATVEGRQLLAGRRLRGPRAGSPLTVLVADDSLSVRRVLAGLFKSIGWTPVTARDGAEALEILELAPRKPDVALLDIEMPRMDGFELTATMKSNPSLASIPVVILTSRAGEKHRDRAFALGASDYVVKPYQDEQLLATLRRVAEAAVHGAGPDAEPLSLPDEMTGLEPG